MLSAVAEGSNWKTVSLAMPPVGKTVNLAKGGIRLSPWLKILTGTKSERVVLVPSSAVA